MLSHNASERFESRFVTVRINKSPSIMFAGMEDSVLGIWVAHGEGTINSYLKCLKVNEYCELRKSVFCSQLEKWIGTSDETLIKF